MARVMVLADVPWWLVGVVSAALQTIVVAASAVAVAAATASGAATATG